MYKRNNRGISLIVSSIVAAVMAMLIMGLSQLVRQRSTQMVYFENMDRAYRLSESGLHNAMSQIIRDPDFFQTEISSGIIDAEGRYESIITTTDVPVPGAYYIVTTATRTADSGTNFVTKLHTIAKVSNVGEYFMAMPDDFSVSPGVDISQGKLYGRVITFLTVPSPPQPTRILKVEYEKVGGGVVPALPWNPTQIVATEGVEPVSSRTFPQVLDDDIRRYQDLAGPHTTTCIFPVPGPDPNNIEIFPPGYFGDQLGPDDQYAGHTEQNAHHIYFCEGPMFIRGRVHGQVLFVATDHIHITGNVTIASGDPLPGDGHTSDHISSSTAHQPIFITRGDVVIDPFTEIPDEVPLLLPPDGSTVTVMGLVLAPHGTFKATGYGQANNDALGLNFIFNGSWILSQIKDNSPKLSDVFKGSRTYGYMTSLKDNPPPYFPALAEIYYSVEETGMVERN